MAVPQRQVFVRGVEVTISWDQGTTKTNGHATRAFSILVFTESMLLSGFFLKKKPPSMLF
jgi:hypothetical protein